MLAHQNPFRTERLHQLAFRSPDFAWIGFWDRLQRLGGRGLIVGPQGSGKTTLVLELRERLRAAGHSTLSVRFDPDDEIRVRAQLSEIGRAARPEQFVLLDGSDRVGPFAWWRLKRRLPSSTGLVLTAHQPGRLPTLHHCRTSFETFRCLVHELVPEPVAAGWPLAEIYEREGGNVRSAFLELYDRLAKSSQAPFSKLHEPFQPTKGLTNP